MSESGPAEVKAAEPTPLPQVRLKDSDQSVLTTSLYTMYKNFPVPRALCKTRFLRKKPVSELDFY